MYLLTDPIHEKIFVPFLSVVCYYQQVVWSISLFNLNFFSTQQLS